MHRFSNNAQSTLESVLAVDAETLVLVAGGGAAFNVFPVDTEDPFLLDGTYQAATLTHADLPGVYEVVYMVVFINDTFQIIRAQEGTEAQEWPAGAKVSANVTAGQLESFVQKGSGGPVDLASAGPLILRDARTDDSDEVGSSSNTGFVVNSKTRLRRTWSIGGNSVLQQTRARSSDQGLQTNAYETIGSSIPVDLGTPRTWVAGQAYRRGAVVQPATPNGLQYWVDILSINDATTSDTTLEFNSAPYERTTGGLTGSGPSEWEGQPMPVVAEIFFSSEVRAVVTEVGFICHQYDATTPPSVSIGTTSDTTRFASAMSLTGLESGSVHRIPIATGGLLVSNLKFAVTTAADGGTCRGNFYWKGFVVEPTPEIT